MQPELRFTLPAAPPPGAVAGGGQEALARGLLLMRASSMSLMRLQLAMERRDRRVTLQTVDELVAIDDRMRDFLQEMPEPGGAFAMLVGEVEQQREALVREKLTLVAGRHGPVVGRGEPEWSEPLAGAGAPAPAREGAAPAPVEAEANWEEASPEVAAEPRRSYALLMIALLIVALLAGAAAYLWGTAQGGELLARLPRLEVIRDALRI